jgi:hypothetical protein
MALLVLRRVGFFHFVIVVYSLHCLSVRVAYNVCQRFGFDCLFLIDWLNKSDNTSIFRFAYGCCLAQRQQTYNERLVITPTAGKITANEYFIKNVP